MNDLPHTILIVEDDERMRRTLAEALHISGFQTALASNCDEAYAIARETSPDLIVCDLHLKGSDGRTLLSSVRNNEGLQSCQFVFITGDRDKELRRTIMNLGADDFLEKPFNVSTFIECINSRIQRLKAASQPEQRILAELRGSVSKVLPHEFLTPLNGIIGLSEVLLLEGNEACDWEETVNDIKKCGYRLHHSIRNYLSILSFAEGANRKYKLCAPQPVGSFEHAVRLLAKEVADRYRRLDDLELTCGMGDHPPIHLNLEWFRWVVEELVDNAFKFSQAETPVVARLRIDGAELSLSVADSGVGMSEDQIRQVGIFRRFDRSSYEQQGLGLGLTLVQHVLEHQNGQIAIQSIQDMGTAVKAVWRLGRTEPKDAIYLESPVQMQN